MPLAIFPPPWPHLDGTHDKKSQRKMTTRGEVCRIKLYIYIGSTGWGVDLIYIYIY